MPHTILVADDEPHILKVLKITLERAGYSVVTACNGREVLQKVASERPDLVILDSTMPYMEGWEALESLRTNPATQTLPVIVLVAKSPCAETFQGWRNSADSYLTKPFNPLELVAFVQKIFGSAGVTD